MASWKRDFGSGLIVLVPLLVTVIVLAWIYGHLTRVPIPLDTVQLLGADVTGPVRVALALIIFVLLVFAVGYLMRTAMGAVFESGIDDLMNSVPGLRVVYNASKMAVETALSGTGELQKPVRLEVWDGIRMTAFKTGNQTVDGREILFMPTAPNITTGFVIEVEQDRYTEIEDDVEDALTRLLSAGFGNNDDIGAAGMFGPSDENAGQVSVSDIEAASEQPTSETPTGDDGTTEPGGDGVTEAGTEPTEGSEVTDGGVASGHGSVE